MPMQTKHLIVSQKSEKRTDFSHARALRRIIYIFTVLLVVNLLSYATPVSSAPPAPSWASDIAYDQPSLISAIISAGTTPTNIELTSDIYLSGSVTIPSSSIIMLSGNNGSLPFKIVGDSSSSVIVVNGELWLDELIITGGAGTGVNYGGGVSNFGTFIMLGGEISLNNAGDYGGGVNNSGSFYLFGGDILNNYASNNGGGVYSNGTFDMSGGTISNNESNTAGGGVYCAGIFEMNGGMISYNKANLGGGVFNFDVFIMHSGSISHNEASSALYGGGGVLNWGGYSGASEFTMYGGEISYNKASNGSGVYGTDEFGIHPLAINISGGKIAYNNATINGGGIYSNNAPLLMDDGEISNNEAINGGGVYVNNCAIEMQDGKISNNEAGTNGGGVYISAGGSAEMSDGEISNNKAVANGGGVFIGPGTFKLSGGALTDNTAQDGGGIDIAASDYTRLEITSTSVVFSGNGADTANALKNPVHIAIHDANIAPGVTWSIPTDYGYNNYDINVTGPKLLFVTFDAQGGVFTDGTSPLLRMVEENSTLASFPAVSYTGYDFFGWYTAQNGGGIKYGNDTVFTTDITLYAYWVVPGMCPVPGCGGTLCPICGECDICGTCICDKTSPTPPVDNGNSGKDIVDVDDSNKDSSITDEDPGDDDGSDEDAGGNDYVDSGDTGSSGDNGGSNVDSDNSDDIISVNEDSEDDVEIILPSSPVEAVIDPGERPVDYTTPSIPAATPAMPSPEILPPQPGLKTITIQFVDWDGTVLSTQVTTPGVAVEPPSPPTRDGYVFTGWDQDFTNPQSNMTIMALYEQIPDTVITPSPVPGAPLDTSPDIKAPETSVIPESINKFEKFYTPEDLTGILDDNVPRISIADLTIPIYAEHLNQYVWSLLNLIFGIAGMILASINMFRALTARKREQVDLETAYIADSGTRLKPWRVGWIFVSIIIGVVEIIMFLLAQDTGKTMVLLDYWTIAYAVMFVAQLTSLKLSFRRNKSSSNEEATFSPSDLPLTK